MSLSLGVPNASFVAAVVAALVAALVPGAVGDRQDADSDPVVVISLTDPAGDRTPVATAGLASDDEHSPADAAVPATLGTSGIVAVAAGPSTSPQPPEELVGDVAVLTPPMETPEFFVAGLTWTGSDDLGAARAFVRLLEQSGWTEWMEIEPEESGPDDPLDGALAGTEPLISGGATGIQVQLTGEASTLPANLGLSLMPDRPGTDVAVVSEPLPEPAKTPSADPTVPEEVLAGELEEALAGEPEEALTERTAPVPTDPVEPPADQGDTSVPGTEPVTPDQTPALPLDLASALPSITTAAFTAPSGARNVTLPTRALPATVVNQPTVVSRAGWGVDESIPENAGTGPWTVRYADLRAAVIHHTAGTNTYTRENSASVVRGIYHYHAVTRGWGDIGYNFLIDRFGRIYEGRSGTLASTPGRMVVAGHAVSYNTGSVGISVMGNFVSTSAPQVSLDAIVNVIAWQFGRGGIDLSDPSGMISPGTSTRPAGQNLPRIFGHRDVANTSCPGTIYGRIPTITSQVRSRLPLLFHLNNAFSARADVSFYFGDRGGEVLVGDWDGDGRDTIAVRTGATFRLRNTHSAGQPDRVFTYGRPGDEVLVGDWDGDGRDTLAVRRGATYHIKNSLTDGSADVVITYGRPDDVVLVGDWNGDGRDTLAVRRGAAYHIRNTLAGGSADAVVTYGRANDVVLVGDWNGDRRDSLAVRRGATYHIKNTLSDGSADTVVTYGRATDAVVVGDWDGNRTDTLGVKRLP